MKKRIISLLLAVITLMQIVPWSVLPIIAEGGISVEDMEVGKLYRAVWNYETYPDLYLYKIDSEDNTKMEQFYGTIMKESLPQDLTVKLNEEGDTFIYVTNEDWPAVYEDYRYVEDYELIILEKIEEEPEIKVGVTYNGAPVKELDLYEDSKKPITAKKPAEIEGKVEWAWEVLVGEKWVRVGDKTTDTLDISYALVVNVLDENGEAKVRAVAIDGETEHPSEPITVQMKNAPKPMEKEFENLSAVSNTRALSYGNGISPLNTATEQITITVNFIKVRPDGTTAQAAYPDIRTLKTDYEAYTVTLPSVLGYYPSLVEPSNPYDFSKNPDKDDSLTTISIAAGLTSDHTVNVYYYPGEEKYTVYHYVQNVNDDNYTEYYKKTEGKATVGTKVPDCHLSITGFQHLYYERPEIATDGSTVVEVYYDREYFTVLFDLVEKGAYGQENLYVKYETEVGLSDPSAPGWIFSSWKQAVVDANGNITDYKTTEYSAGRTNIHKVTEAVTFRAVWEGAETTYSVVYWLENPNDGNYSVWYTESDLKYVTTDNKSSLATAAASGVKVATSGGYVKWNEVIPEYIYDDPIYQFVTLNTTKTEADWDATDGVILEGDKSSTVDVYFNRRTYNISFLATPDSSLIHNHETDPCVYNPMYCTHIHSDTCKVSTHTHTSSCALSCTLTEHMHRNDCCDTHVHGVACYSNDANMSSSLLPIVQNLVEDDIERQYSNENWFSSLVGEIVKYAAGDSAAEAATTASSALSSAAPPQNLQNGYVYVLKDVEVSYEGKGTFLWFIPVTASGTIKVDVPAIYIDNGNDDKTDDWYYYNGSLEDGKIQEADSCNLPDHDHTSGCTYGTKCKETEHVHNDNCYTCGLANGTCPHQHTADCYGNVCMVPSYEQYKDTNASIDGYYTVLRLQAKYGQNITEYLPYYLELTEYGLNKDASDANFVGWQYAGTGWADKGETRYVKHVTMVDELCYSNGVTATAEYTASAKNAYLLYYLFESFDQSSAAENYGLNGDGRQEYNGVWYDSDPVHMQLIMWPSAGGTVDGGQKEILGMNYVGMTGGNLTLDLGTVNQNLSGIKAETLNAYFYGRKTDNKVSFHNGGQTILTVPVEGQANPLKFGLSLGDLAAALKNSDVYGNFDVNDVPYPSNLEANAYVFDGWYTTPYQSEYTKVDWETDTLSEGELNLYAYWKPVTRYVTVYEDATLQTRFEESNKGYQEVGHRSYAIAPDYSLSQYAKEGYKFNGWFYVDPVSGEEKAFLFNFPVTQDLQIYAKWTLDIVVPYEIHYVVESPKGSGNFVKVANSVIGTAVAGQNKTFRAATGNALLDDYQEGFFPMVGSHTVQMQVKKDDKGNLLPNVYEFVYEEVEKINYWVRFVDSETGEIFDSTNEKYPATIQRETRKAAVTELFVPIEGYTVDKYSKSLIISATDPEVNNIITFYYTKVEEDKPITAPWVVNHMIQNADGTYSVYQQSSHTDVVTPGDDHMDIYFGTVLNNIDGYKFATVDVKTRKLDPVTSEVQDIIITTEAEGLQAVMQNDDIKYGYELNEYGMEINLYYDRDNVGYTVQYKDADSDTIFYSYNVAHDAEGAVPHGDSVTVTLNQQEHMKIVMNEGYQLVDDTQTSITMTLYIDESRNVITFLYQKFDATFEYQIVCDDPTSGVGLSMTRETIAAGSDDALMGAIPYESETYYFAGWFVDEACSIPVDPNTHSVTLVSEELYEGYFVPRLTPTKTQFEYTDENGDAQTGNLYLSATYYALFLPRSADLTVTVSGATGDTFILTLVGKEGTFAEGTVITIAVIGGQTVTLTDMPIGEYTVTADEAWSWRYEKIEATATVKVKDGGSVTVSPVSKNDQWLTDEDIGTPGWTLKPTD